MKTEAEIRDWLTKPLKKTPEYLPMTYQISFEQALWYARNVVRKIVLGEIPDDVHAYHCQEHKEVYLAKEGHNIGCPQCPEHDIWEPEEKT